MKRRGDYSDVKEIFTFFLQVKNSFFSAEIHIRWNEGAAGTAAPPVMNGIIIYRHSGEISE